jgi:hypothetical protein
MVANKAASILVLVIGIGLFVVSLLADVVGIGDNAGFGYQQILVAIAGIVVLAIGLVFTLGAK